MQWYYSKQNTQLGPVEEAELRAKIASGEVTAADLVWREGMADWMPAGRIPEFGVNIMGPSATAYQPTMPPPPPAATYYAPPMAPPVNLTSQASSKATTSMVLGIVSLVFALCSCYGTLIVLPCAILAIVFGGQAKGMTGINEPTASDLSKAKAGVIMGWIAIAINIGLIVLSVLWVGLSQPHYVR